MTQHVTLNSHHCLQDIADMLEEASKVIVMTGAGISTSAGIPVGILVATHLNDLVKLK